VPLASVAVPGPQNLVEEKDVYAYRQYITICSSSCHCIMRDSIGLQNIAFVGSAWDAIQMGFGIPVGGKVTTTYDQNDQPTQAEVHDANGQVLCRIVGTYDANGQVTEEKPSWINPASVFWDKMPAEQRAQLNPEEVKRFSQAMVTVMNGQAQAGAWYTYNSQNRLTTTRERNMMFEKTTTISYNTERPSHSGYVPHRTAPIAFSWETIRFFLRLSIRPLWQLDQTDPQ